MMLSATRVERFISFLPPAGAGAGADWVDGEAPFVSAGLSCVTEFAGLSGPSMLGSKAGAGWSWGFRSCLRRVRLVFYLYSAGLSSVTLV
ncbi:hypothetical protein GCM10023321_29640 [Pseudonocardia eucalypti]|uniref:Secreted protein n=1 Tax=Pseudonocardia eucalypti TaxID=648755 RepID=A0ABP9Q1F9_9PSEU